jgi:hypothetical protein
MFKFKHTVKKGKKVLTEATNTIQGQQANIEGLQKIIAEQNCEILRLQMKIKNLRKDESRTILTLQAKESSQALAHLEEVNGFQQKMLRKNAKLKNFKDEKIKKEIILEHNGQLMENRKNVEFANSEDRNKADLNRIDFENNSTLREYQ